MIIDELYNHTLTILHSTSHHGLGSHVIVHAMSDVDTSGTSYYGSSSLYILSTDGKTANIVSQSKEGPVYGIVYKIIILSFAIEINME